MAGCDAPFLHLVHPRPVAWSFVMEPLAKTLGLPVVSYDDWVTRLEQSGDALSADEEVEVMRLNPALKIIDMFIQGRSTVATRSSDEAMGLPQLDVEQAKLVSPHLSPESLPQLSDADAARWLMYWKKIGHL